MKHAFFSFALILTGISFGQNSEKASKTAKPTLKFTTLEIVRDSIPYDSKDLFIFEFKNNSKKPATIQGVQTSCGCTAAEKPTEAVKPGKKSKISVSYDTKRVGQFTKTITVTSDVSEPIVLTIRGTVLPQKTEPVKN
ncbi:MAG: DUF1573 domain-containing protein [Crocinitomicaceae bacterium]|jgi:hypothetical protein